MLYHFHLPKHWSQRNSITSPHRGVKLLEHSWPLGGTTELSPHELLSAQRGSGTAKTQKHRRKRPGWSHTQLKHRHKHALGALKPSWKEGKLLFSKIPFFHSIELKPGCSSGIWILLTSSFLRASSCSCFSLAILWALSASAFLRSSCSFSLARFSKLARMLLVLLATVTRKRIQGKSRLRFCIKVAWNEFELQISAFLPSDLIVKSVISLFLPPPSQLKPLVHHISKKTLCNASPSSPSWYSLHHCPTRFIFPYFFLILMLFSLPSLTLMSLKRKQNKLEQSKTTSKGGRKSIWGCIRAANAAVPSGWALLSTNYMNIPKFRTLPPPKKAFGPMPYQLLLAWSSGKLMLVSQYLQKLLHSNSKDKKDACKNPHKFMGTFTQPQSEIFYCDPVPKAFCRTSKPNQKESKLDKQNNPFCKSS